MTIWQAVTADEYETVIHQANSAYELAEKLHISVGAVYTYFYRQKKQHCGRNTKYKIVKIVVDD